MASNALRYSDGPKRFMGVPSYFDAGDVGDAVAGVGNALYELARSPLTASEGLLNAIGSGDRWAPGLALLDYLANVPGPTESLIAKLGPLTAKGVNALSDVYNQAMLIGPKSALWKKLPQVGEDIPQGAFSNLYDRTTALEIPDDASRMLVKSNAELMDAEQTAIRGEIYRHQDTLRRLEERASDETDITKLQEIQDMHDYISGKVKSLESKSQELYSIGGVPERTMSTSEAYYHPSLYEAYPELEGYRTRFTNEPGGRFGGQEITLGMNADREMMGHELQHPIQKIEGWARGGSPEHIPLDMNNEIYEKLAKPLREAAKNAKTPEEANTYIQKLYNLQDNIEMIAYRNLLGEIMARDTAARMALTGEQRTFNALAHPLAGQGGLAPDARWSVLSTENIPLEDAIVRYANPSGNAMMESVTYPTLAERRNALSKPYQNQTRFGLGGDEVRESGTVFDGEIKTLQDYKDTIKKHIQKEKGHLKRPEVWFKHDNPNIMTVVNSGESGGTIAKQYDLSQMSDVDFETVAKWADTAPTPSSNIYYPGIDYGGRQGYPAYLNEKAVLRGWKDLEKSRKTGQPLKQAGYNVRGKP